MAETTETGEARRFARELAKGRSLFWPSVVVALLGAGVLYQREGGRVFDPKGPVRLYRLVAEQINPPAPAPRVPILDQFEARKKRQGASSSLFIKSMEDCLLEDVEVSLEMGFEGGGTTTLRRFWGGWRPDEEKSLLLDETNGSLERMHLTGTALQGLKQLDARSGARCASDLGACPLLKERPGLRRRS